MQRIVLVLAGLAAIGQGARAGLVVGLGPATGYNEFIFNNSTRSNSDVQGKVAVGGNLSLTNMSIADKASAGNNLLVGGNLTQLNGSVNGDAQIGGKANLTNTSTSGVTYHVDNLGGSSSNNGAKIVASSGLTSGFFSDAASVLTSESAYLGSLANTGNAAVVKWGNQLFFDAGSDSFALFHVTASQLRNAGMITYISAVANTTFVVDVDDDGTAYSIANTGTAFQGANPSDVGHVLYNFYNTNATAGNNSVSFSSVNGSVLAPLATVNFNNGGLNGQLVANNLNGSGESHLWQYGNVGGTPDLFVGSLPTRPSLSVQAVPEPSTMMLSLIAGVGGVWTLHRRRRAA